jgi:hypothetical protein
MKVAGERDVLVGNGERWDAEVKGGLVKSRSKD